MLLDIDFDYFVKETTFHDFSYHESEFFTESMWDIRFITAYGNPFSSPIDLTKELILDEDALRDVLDFIKKCSEVKSWAISDSHLFAYRYIQDDAIYSILDGIVHIDRHNDYDIIYDKIHAGNWLRYIKENLPGAPIYWIPQSKKDLYVDEKTVKGVMKIKNRAFLKSLDPCKVDCIYLSKSSAWVPSWLDSAYFKFQRELEKLFVSPIIYEPAPKKRAWDYEKLIECGIKERDAINAIRM
jgi:hypothetical protein